MTRNVWIPLAVVALAAGYWAWEHFARSRADTIEYRGERIKLSKRYDSFDAYKNDPDNIDPSENARVQKLVMEAPVAASYASRIELAQGVGHAVFPGYGWSNIPGQMSDGTELLCEVIEIPRADKDRYLLFRQRAGHFEKIDDFVEESHALISTVREENGWLLFLAYGDNKEQFRRPVPKH